MTMTKEARLSNDRDLAQLLRSGSPPPSGRRAQASRPAPPFASGWIGFFVKVSFSAAMARATRTARILVVGSRTDPAFAPLASLPSGAKIVGYCGAVDHFSPTAGATATTSAGPHLRAALNSCNVVLMAPQGHHGKDLMDFLLQEAKGLEWVHSRWAGVDAFLTEKLKASPVPLTNAKGLFSNSLAEYTMFACGWFAKRARELRENQARGKWQKLTVKELRGASFGVIGFGDIGRSCAVLAKAYGMRVLAQRRRPELCTSDALVDEVFGTGADELKRIAASSDYLVVAAPLTPDTRHMVNAEVLASMKPGCVIVNVGRGPVIDEQALTAAILDDAHPIGGAALDVFEKEPLSQDSPLWQSDKVLVSPHCADQTPTFLADSVELFVENVERFLSGAELKNPVDKQAGY